MPQDLVRTQATLVVLSTWRTLQQVSSLNGRTGKQKSLWLDWMKTFNSIKYPRMPWLSLSVSSSYNNLLGSDAGITGGLTH